MGERQRICAWLCCGGDSASIAGILPAAGQGLTGGEAQLTLGEVVGILELLAAMDAARHHGAEGVDQLAQIEDLHERGLLVGGVAVLMQGEEHRDGAVGKP